MNKLNLLLIFAVFLSSCSSIKEAGKILRNEKKNTTDEFLVKKRSPLVLPPDFGVVPEPGSISKNRIDWYISFWKIDTSSPPSRLGATDFRHCYCGWDLF